MDTGWIRLVVMISQRPLHTETHMIKSDFSFVSSATLQRVSSEKSLLKNYKDQTCLIFMILDWGGSDSIGSSKIILLDPITCGLCIQIVSTTSSEVSQIAPQPLGRDVVLKIGEGNHLMCSQPKVSHLMVLVRVKNQAVRKCSHTTELKIQQNWTCQSAQNNSSFHPSNTEEVWNHQQSTKV